MLSVITVTSENLRVWPSTNFLQPAAFPSFPSSALFAYRCRACTSSARASALCMSAFVAFSVRPPPAESGDRGASPSSSCFFLNWLLVSSSPFHFLLYTFFSPLFSLLLLLLCFLLHTTSPPSLHRSSCLPLIPAPAFLPASPLLFSSSPQPPLFPPSLRLSPLISSHLPSLFPFCLLLSPPSLLSFSSPHITFLLLYTTSSLTSSSSTAPLLLLTSHPD